MVLFLGYQLLQQSSFWVASCFSRAVFGLPITSVVLFLGCLSLQWYCFWVAYHFSGTVFGLPITSVVLFLGCQLLQMSSFGVASCFKRAAWQKHGWFEFAVRGQIFDEISRNMRTFKFVPSVSWGTSQNVYEASDVRVCQVSQAKLTASRKKT